MEATDLSQLVLSEHPIHLISLCHLKVSEGSKHQDLYPLYFIHLLAQPTMVEAIWQETY